MSPLRLVSGSPVFTWVSSVCSPLACPVPLGIGTEGLQPSCLRQDGNWSIMAHQKAGGEIELQADLFR